MEHPISRFCKCWPSQGHQCPVCRPAAQAPVHKNLQHMIFVNGRWMLFRSKWKSQFRDRRYHAACVTGATVREVSSKAHQLRRYK